MSHKDTAFYRGNQQVNFDFSAEEISSDGAVLLLEKLERKHKFRPPRPISENQLLTILLS